MLGARRWRWRKTGAARVRTTYLLFALDLALAALNLGLTTLQRHTLLALTFALISILAGRVQVRIRVLATLAGRRLPGVVVERIRRRKAWSLGRGRRRRARRRVASRARWGGSTPRSACILLPQPRYCRHAGLLRILNRPGVEDEDESLLDLGVEEVLESARCAPWVSMSGHCGWRARRRGGRQGSSIHAGLGLWSQIPSAHGALFPLPSSLVLPPSPQTIAKRYGARSPSRYLRGVSVILAPSTTCQGYPCCLPSSTSPLFQ